MKLSLSPADLTEYLEAQLHATFPDRRRHALRPVVDAALERLEYCFSWIALPRYTENGVPCFHHLHGDQSATLLYFAANAAWRLREDTALAEKLFLLNKSINGLVCMYDTELPRVFALIHTVGLVLGKAHYDERLAVFQNVTIGADRGVLPRIGRDVVVYGGAVVAGDVCLGDGSVVAGNSAVIHQSVPENSIVAGRSPALTIAARTRDVIGQYFFTTRDLP